MNNEFKQTVTFFGEKHSKTSTEDFFAVFAAFLAHYEVSISHHEVSVLYLKSLSSGSLFLELYSGFWKPNVYES